MARASKPRLPRKVSITEAKRLADQAILGDSHWHDLARDLFAGLLVTDPKGENTHLVRQPTSPVAIFDPLDGLDPNSRQFNDDIASIADAVIFTPPGADGLEPESHPETD